MLLLVLGCKLTKCTHTFNTVDVFEEEEVELEHYIGYSSHFIHTCIVHSGKKGETEIGYKETWNSTTAILVACPE